MRKQPWLSARNVIRLLEDKIFNKNPALRRDFFQIYFIEWVVELVAVFRAESKTASPHFE